MTSNSEVVDTAISNSLPTDHAWSTGFVRVLRASMLPGWEWLTRHIRNALARRVTRRLRVAETVSLGEKRFVSILEVDGEQILVGGSTSNIVLLAKMERKPEAVREDFERIFSRLDSDATGRRPGGKGSIEAAQ